MKYFIVFTIVILQSCGSAYNFGSDIKRAKQYFRIYRRLEQDTPNIYRCYIILKPQSLTYEQYSEAGLSVIGKYSIKNDTLIMRHEHELRLSDSIYIHKMRDTGISEFYPQRFLIRKDSLIDITNHYEHPADSGMFIRGHDDYVLVK